MTSMSAVFACVTRQISATPASDCSGSGSMVVSAHGGLIQFSGL
jgi:hypothetical protein